MDMVVYQTNGYSTVGPFMIFSGVENYENEPFEGEVFSWDGVGPGDYFAGQVVNLHDIDGDGSVLMNMNTLATIGNRAPTNYTLLIIDNGSYLCPQ